MAKNKGILLLLIIPSVLSQNISTSDQPTTPSLKLITQYATTGNSISSFSTLESNVSISTEESIATHPDTSLPINKRVAAVGKIQDALHPNTQSSANTSQYNSSTVASTTPKCNREPSFCILMLSVLQNTISPTAKPSAGNTTLSLMQTTPTSSGVKSTTTNWHDMMREVIRRSYFNSSTTVSPSQIDRKTFLEEMNSYNRTNVDVSSVNSILSKLETMINSSTSLTFDEAGTILLKISTWKSANKQTIEKSSRVVSNMITALQNNASIASKNVIENTTQNILRTMENIVTSSVTRAVSVSTPTVDILTHTVEENITANVLVSTSGGLVVLSHQLFVSRIVRISTVVYHSGIGENLGGTHYFGNAEISSDVVAVSLEEVNHTIVTPLPVKEQGAIIITLPTDIRKREKKRICTYWSFKRKRWASDGGTILDKNDTHTTCRFDHLTDFAVLVLYYDDDEQMLSIKQENILMIMTTIGCSISITCLGMTIVAFAYLRLMCRETILIHGHLSFALLCGQLILVASDDAVEHYIACKAVAMTLHYFFLSAFSWMMVEGIALYFSCTRSLYNHGDMRLKYCVIGWVVPLVIVVISIGADFADYGASKRCWLSTDDGLIWAFMGPMLIIIMFNIFILGLVVRVFLTLEANSRKSDAAKVRVSIRAMVFLLPLLGITWLLSVLVPLHAAFHYLFIVGNSLQGMMIFFFHCICNEEIRKKFIEKKNKLSSTQRTFDCDQAGVSKRRKKKESFCDVQIEIPSTDRKYAWVS